MTVTDAAHQVLLEAGQPLHYEEITRRLLARRLWQPRTKTPAATVGAQLYSDIKNRGSASRFRRVEKGVFALNGEGDGPATAALSFGDAAESVLERFANRKPMHYREIADKALQLGLVTTQGETPEATLRAHIYREVERQEQRGERPRFTRHPRGYIGLSRWKGNEVAVQVEQHNHQIRGKLRARLLAMPPDEFEALVGELLVSLGFEQVSVTSRSNDGGIDVRGTLVVGDVIRTRMAVQVKRWKANVQAPVVQQVRGSLGAHEQGLIVTTSDFSPGARQEAARSDATPVALMDGEEFVKLLMENEIGVRRSRLELFELAPTGDEKLSEDEEVIELRALPDPIVTFPLEALLHGDGTAVTGSKPQAITFPDGRQQPVSAWLDLAVAIVDWLDKSGNLPPLPFSTGTGKRHFLNATPDHKAEPMVHFVPVHTGGRTIYLHTKNSAKDFVRYIGKLCAAGGYSPSQFTIALLRSSR